MPAGIGRRQCAPYWAGQSPPNRRAHTKPPFNRTIKRAILSTRTHAVCQKLECIMAKNTSNTPGVKIIAKNKRAWFDYSIEEKYECGIALLGSEVKSIRAGHISIGESYAKFSETGMPELFLVNAHIAEYPWANRNNHEPLRNRKLLLHRRELAKLSQVIVRQGLTLVPLSMYFKCGKIKVELGLCRGKKNYDKREALKTRTAQRDVERGD